MPLKSEHATRADPSGESSHPTEKTDFGCFYPGSQFFCAYTEFMAIEHISNSEFFKPDTFLTRAAPGNWEVSPGVQPELTGGIIYPIWPGSTSGSVKESWKALLG
ncbi:unnamed protein product [Pleuronectes platessa]|uniref:Uncharacterized protein n=1 Tax=Pleuronectes platessa TaxID=8262 RepID=A0A9N7TP51_PLEPL|nr:unnamed protein product [Pleuronectes platessa]